MFRAMISPIFRSTRLCVTACGIMHPRCCRPLAWKRRNSLVCRSICSCIPATSWVHYTTSCNAQSSAPEDGRNNRPKHFELIGIINKPLLFHPVGCLYYLFISMMHGQANIKFTEVVLFGRVQLTAHAHMSQA